MQNSKNRYLPDVFKELQSNQPQKKSKSIKEENFSKIEYPKNKTIKIPAYIVFLIVCFIFSFVLFCTNTISSASDDRNGEDESQVLTTYFEPNNNTLDMQNIINNNIEIVRKKEVVYEEREINF